MSAKKHINPKNPDKGFWFRLIGLAVIPLLLAGLYAVAMEINAQFRYDESFFSPAYQEAYPSPGAVARALEGILKRGDTRQYHELTGLRRSPQALKPHPNKGLAILLEVDDHDYFHYLYFDTDSFQRDTRYIKEMKSRWVVSPEDVFFFYDSGRWVSVVFPLALVWWLLLIVYMLAWLVWRAAAKTRSAMGMSA
jgi:hypothetical protein